MDRDYDDYIVFLLGADNFETSKLIRQLAGTFGMDTLFDNCVYIAKRFETYDKERSYTSKYINLQDFLDIYNDEIRNYLLNGTRFEVRKVF